MLHKTIGRDFPDAFGRIRRLDALAIDAGFRSSVVYATVHNNQRISTNGGYEMLFAVDGRDGWSTPPLGSPSLVDVDLTGRRSRKGAKLWPVGTWGLKGTFYEDLRKEGKRSGAEVDPGGYVHFPHWLDEGYMRQITAEYLADDAYRGRARKVWKQRPSQRDNHWLDCRVYNMAIAEHLGLSTLTADEWARLAKERGAPVPDALPLFGESADARFERLMKENQDRLGNMFKGNSISIGEPRR
jgi:phage terminase large subunit GpA-like protein